jgi:short-subunit dehydrogenase
LFFDAFWVSDEQLRRLGWEPRVSIDTSIEALVMTERREQGGLPPGGEGWSLVTGAGSGLGRACAMELAGSGRKLLLVDKDEEALKGVLTEYELVRRVPCDLSNQEDLAALLRSDAWSKEGVDELYACAGIGARGSVLSLPDEVHSRVLAVNVMSRIVLIRHAIGGMLERGVAGRIVIVSSSTAFQPVPYMAVYGATNAALLSFGQSLCRTNAWPSQGMLRSGS